jgi:SAM-dependent methyltransferase
LASIPVSLTLNNIIRCIREGRFLESRLSTHPLYITEVKRKISKKTKIIDLGCCFGTDIRYLVADGAEPSLITGTDQFPEYIQLGFDLFGDKDKLTTRFIFEDFFSEQFAQKALNNNTDDSSKYDIAYAGSVYHLFSLEQTEKFTQLVSSLLKSGKSLLVTTA